MSYDAGWSTCGSGRSYNSDTEHGTMIGDQTGKCVAFNIKTKRCRICETAERKNVVVRQHKCFRNWKKSSKAMEAAMGVEMVDELHTTSSFVDTLIMDNDATTLKHVNAKHSNIKKKSDRNHTKKCISNTLYSLRASHKILNNTNVLRYICKMYKYAIEQNQGNPTELKSRLSQVVPHMYGEHNSCDVWCKKRETPAPYKELPYKKCLSDKSL